MSNQELAKELLSQGKITAEQAKELAASSANWDYIPGGRGENAYVLACAGIPPDMGLYGQDIYLGQQLKGEQKTKYAELLNEGLGVQRALKEVGIEPYAPIT